MASTNEILYSMRDLIADWMMLNGYGVSVYIAEARVDEIIGQFAVQIIPSTDTAVHPNSGVGLIRSQVDVIVWWRGFLDPMQRATERIAGESGIQKFADSLREFLTQRLVVGMTIPLLFRNGGSIQPVEGLDGWLTLSDSYDYAYEMTWEVK